MKFGPSYGYHANALKTWLVVKKEFQPLAESTQVQITSEGHPHLGTPLGTPDYVSQYVSDKVHRSLNYSLQLPTLNHMLLLHMDWLSFLSRTVPSISHHMKVLENIVQTELIPSLTGCPPLNEIDRKLMALPVRLGGLGIGIPIPPLNEIDRKLMALPVRLGGLGIGIPSMNSNDNFNASLLVTRPLRQRMNSHDTGYSYEVLHDQMTAKAEIHQKRREQVNVEAARLRDELTPSLQRAMDLARLKWSSSWLTVLPLEEHGFSLHKGAFVDALALRYGWTPSRLPTCCVCGASFTVEHALSCPCGGFPSIRHNEIRDLTATLLSEVCNDVCVKPDLQAITTEELSKRTANTTDGARLDIAANGFWGGRFKRTFVDVQPSCKIQQEHHN